MPKIKTVLNYSEKKIFIKIKKAIGSDRQVFPSISLGNVLNISRDELTEEEFNLALKTNFDFVITDINFNPLFAIEFDGPVHKTKTKQLIDRTKNRICEKFGFPLLRIDSDLNEAKIDNFEILEWLVNLHFIYEGFCKMQEESKIPQDEPFFFGNVIDFDPFIQSRANIQRMWKKGYIKTPIPYCLVTNSDDNYYHSLSAVEYLDDIWVYGEASCRMSFFPAIPASELSEELSAVILEKNLMKKIMNLDVKTLTTEDILRKRMNSKKIKEYGFMSFKK